MLHTTILLTFWFVFSCASVTALQRGSGSIGSWTTLRSWNWIPSRSFVKTWCHSRWWTRWLDRCFTSLSRMWSETLTDSEVERKSRIFTERGESEAIIWRKLSARRLASTSYNAAFLRALSWPWLRILRAQQTLTVSITSVVDIGWQSAIRARTSFQYSSKITPRNWLPPISSFKV